MGARKVGQTRVRDLPGGARLFRGMSSRDSVEDVAGLKMFTTQHDGKAFCGVRGDTCARSGTRAAARRGRMFEVLDTVDFGVSSSSSSPGMIKGRAGLSAPPCHDALARLIGSHRGSAVKDARKRWHDDKVERALSPDASLVLSSFLEEEHNDLAYTISRAAMASKAAMVDGRRLAKVRGRRSSQQE